MKNNKNNSINFDVNHIIKSARLKLGITQSELAKKIGISPSAIGMYEQGRRIPDYDTLLKLCKVLKIPIYNIFLQKEVFNADSILKFIIENLNSNNDAILNNNILDQQKKNSIAYMLNLILNDNK